MTAVATAAREPGRAALLQRLDQIGALLFDRSTRDDVSSRGPGPYLDLIARTVRARADDELTWVSMAAFTATYPTSELFDWFRRALSLADESTAMRVFLQVGSKTGTGFEDLSATVEIVTGAVLVDVDFPARHGANTGIQRVVRQTVARWHASHEIIPVAWMHGSMSFRRLGSIELERVVDWGTSSRGAWRHGEPDAVRIVVPYRSVVVEPSVPAYHQCGPLASLAAVSGNAVVILGHDAIPIVSADTVPPEETVKFANFLSVVKHARTIATVSRAAAVEFEGFVRALPAQGLTGPEIVPVPLPVDMPDGLLERDHRPGELPMLLSVGSQEPRKNHLAVLFAAETLWREGRRFSLRFIGGANPWALSVFDPKVKELRAKGRPVEVLRGVSDDVLASSYLEARALVFPSIHEGYGLPVAEALAVGLPVITSRYGSTGQIAEGGGCIVLDPNDDEELVAAMRTVLESEDEVARLRSEALARPPRTWDDYATELWDTLVVPNRDPRVEAEGTRNA